MKDLLIFVLYIVMFSVPTVCAAYLAAHGASGWGWFLALAVLLLIAVRFRITSP